MPPRPKAPKIKKSGSKSPKKGKKEEKEEKSDDSFESEAYHGIPGQVKTGEYVVEEIIDKKITNGVPFWLVKWKYWDA